MEIIITIIGVILLFLAAKKKPVFGQLTLTGDLALDWVKQGVENKITTVKIEFGAASLFAENFNIPEWHLDKGIVAILYPISEWGNPILITQKSILRPLESMCSEWETEGAKCDIIKAQLGSICRVSFEEGGYPTIEMFKHKKAIQFAPYEVKFS